MTGWLASVSVTSVVRSKERDAQAWLLIGAIFIGTMLLVWLPLLFGAMHS
jgi:hypothetical protein